MSKYLFILGLFFVPLSSHADLFEPGDSILLQTNLWTTHFDQKDDHSDDQQLINIELDKASGWVFGFASFRNSFDQPSQYLYLGHSWTISKTADLAYFKLTGGLLHGYKDPHENAIPYNDYGTAPAILPSFGIKYKRFQTELMLFGAAGLMVTVGVNFPSGDQE